MAHGFRLTVNAGESGCLMRVAGLHIGPGGPGSLHGSFPDFWHSSEKSFGGANQKSVYLFNPQSAFRIPTSTRLSSSQAEFISPLFYARREVISLMRA
jgi:hypothetical protein